MSGYCASCGCGLPQKANFCPACGVRVEPEKAATASPEYVAQTEMVSGDDGASSAGSAFPWTLVAIILSLGVLVPLAGWLSIKSPAPGSEPKVQDVIPELANAVDTARDNNGGWSYDESNDEVSGGKIMSATLSSSNRIQQGFPYGETALRVSIRRHPRWGRDVYFTLDSGQLVCGVSDGCFATIRFDNERPRRVRLNEPSDNSSDTLFAVGALAPTIAKSKRMVVELEVYEAGTPQFIFDTKGLDAKRAGL